MSLTLLMPPATEPVTLAEARLRLRVGSDAHDATINQWIAAARERVELETGRALLSQVWLERRDRWDGDGRLTAFGTRFRLLRPPLIALEAVTTYDADGTPSDHDPAAFFVDTLADPGRIALKPGQDWPEPGAMPAGSRSASGPAMATSHPTCRRRCARRSSSLSWRWPMAGGRCRPSPTA